jgi:hypothetical protein
VGVVVVVVVVVVVMMVGGIRTTSLFDAGPEPSKSLSGTPWLPNYYIRSRPLQGCLGAGTSLGAPPKCLLGRS